MANLTRLRDLLGGPDFAWLIERLRHRLERGRGIDGAISLRRPSEAQREAVARLFGRPPATGATLTVRLPELDALLRRAELCEGIIDAVERLSGPLADRRAQRTVVEARWRRFFDEAARRIGARPALRAWLDDLCATGLLRRLARSDVAVARLLLDYALELADRLPAPGVPLAELAAAVTGDSHALDAGEPLGTLAVRLAAALAGIEAWGSGGDRRDVWASVGVLCDELSAPVLTVNLRGDRSTPTGRMLAMHADLGEPYRLSTRQLLRSPPAFAPAISGRTVYVCENPTVVAAATNRLGARSAPLVCVEGQPRTAARLLLDQLVASGARLAYHGDFDWGGIRIANIIIARYGATPWRYSAADYRAAPAGAALRGPSVAACWDPELERAMIASGRAVYEEQVLAALLTDLASGAAEVGS